MCKFVNNTKHGRIDKCMETVIEYFKKQGRTTLACCCGHKKYKKTVVVKTYDHIVEWYSGETIKRKKRFYKKDKKGMYYIPEVEKLN